MMASLGLSVLQSAVGLLVDKSRDWVAKQLSDGNVTNDTFRTMIARETDEIKRQLDGIARKDLNTSISYFNEGAYFLFELMNKKNSPRSPEAALNIAKLNWASTVLKNESDKRMYDMAKDCFRDADRKARKAFQTPALSPSDRIRAMTIRVAATILEKLDEPEFALKKCVTCLEELHNLSAVWSNFKVALKGNWIAKYLQHNERWKIISTVCHVNHVVHDIKCMLGKDIEMPPIDTRDGETVYPLNDSTVRAELRQLNLDFVLPEVEREHDLNNNDNRDNGIKSQGEQPRQTCILDIDIIHVAIDMNNNTYVWVELEKGKGSAEYKQRSYQCSRV